VLSVVLKALPRQPGALHLMGAMLSLRGESAKALDAVGAGRPTAAQRCQYLERHRPGLRQIGACRRCHPASYQQCISWPAKPELTAKALDNLGRLQLSFDASWRQNNHFVARRNVAPGFGLAWYGLAQALIQQDKLAEGLEAAHEAVRLMPKSMARVVLADVAVQSRVTSRQQLTFISRCWMKILTIRGCCITSRR
jgi:hypothetical protein